MSNDKHDTSGNTEKASGDLRRILNVWLAIALGASALGFAIGLRTVHAPTPGLPHAGPVLDTSAARAPMDYTALRDQRPRATVATGDLVALRAAIPGRGDEAARVDPKEEVRLRPEARRQRAQRRAYDGAPPTIPHPIAERDTATCLSCHVDGLKLVDKSASPLPHQAYASCVHCHAATTDSALTAALDVDNDFKGLSSEYDVPRPWQGAPPMIPPTTWQRERCASCHGPAGKPGLRTSHPERHSCVQCHAAAVWPTTALAPWPLVAAQ